MRLSVVPAAMTAVFRPRSDAGWILIARSSPSEARRSRRQEFAGPAAVAEVPQPPHQEEHTGADRQDDSDARRGGGPDGEVGLADRQSFHRRFDRDLEGEGAGGARLDAHRYDGGPADECGHG